VIATSEAWAHRLRQVRIVTGAILHPMAAYLLHRGLPTLAVRVRQMEQSAGELARRLARHPAVVATHYPGLPGGDPQRLIGRQMSGPGSLVAFELAGGLDAARTLLASLRKITHAVSLGSTDSLIQHPAGLTHRLVEPEARRAAGITDGMLRLSVGLEDADDLWADLERGLDRLALAERDETVAKAVVAAA
jgi:cystathionine beta-lyase/cystathionine gamma-synthase